MTDIFADLVAEKGTNPEADAPNTGVEAAESAETNASEWPKTLTLPVGEAPEGAVSVAEFAKAVNEKVVGDRVQELLAESKSPLEAAMEAMTAQVNAASFYQAVKAQRNPLPHYVVTYEVPVLDDDNKETGETKTEEKFFVPVEVGLDWWTNRPTRGGAGTRTSEEDLGKRLYRAGKKVADLKSAKERHAKLTAVVEKMTAQVEDYQKRLEADGKTLYDATAAYEAQAEKDEAEKAIGDNE